MRALVVLALAGLVSGCAGDYVARTRGVREAYEHGDYDAALKDLDAVEKDGSEKDTLLTLLDRGMVLHAAGRWKESIEVLSKADQLSQQLDATSVSEEAGALLSNERQRAYRGEDFEKVTVSVLQALNYLQVGTEEDAMVEVRRVNERLLKMVNDEKKPYEQLAIARYLGGVIYEDQGDEDGAFIDYAQALKLEPRLASALVEPILRLAKKTDRDDAYREIAARYPGVDASPLSAGEGQVVVVVESGLVPQKESADQRNSGLGVIQIPAYHARPGTQRVQVRVDEAAATASDVTSLSDVAVVHLQDRVGRMIAKQVAGAAVKGAVAATAGAVTKSPELGFLTFFLLNLGNAPDLRSWLSLPADFQIARFRVPAGKHTVRIEGTHRFEQTVDVKPRRTTILVTRQP